MSNVLEQVKSSKELRREREQRITDAIRLRVTDRIPVSCEIGNFAAKYAGIPCSAAYYDWDAWVAAYRKTLQDFQPDMAFTREPSAGKGMEYLDPKYMKWPGHGVDPNHSFQAVELEAMKDNEYELFLNNTADFMLRSCLPRTHGNLGGFSMLPSLSDTGWMEPWIARNLGLLFTEPKMEATIQNLQKAGREFRKLMPKLEEFHAVLAEYGIPELFQGAAMPPYDVISNSMRGMKGTMLDMYRQPERLQETCEFILQKTLHRPLPPPNEYGNTRIFITNTRGSEDFISARQFEKFYWPTFKKLVMSFIERGATPCIFFEGTFTSRLEYLQDFPKGSILVRLDRTDIFRAKEVLKDHLCIEGNVPCSLLQIASVHEVKNYCKRLIDIVGKGGGYILGPRSSTDEVKPENLKAMIEFTKEYGRY